MNPPSHLKASLTRFDQIWSKRLCVIEEQGFKRTAAIILTHSGDALPLLILIALLIIAGSAQWQYRGLMLLAADLGTFLIVQILKYTIRRERPPGEWGKGYRRIDPHSFPSGHASRGGAVALMALLTGPWWFGLLFALWGPLVALSRVMVGVHHLLDSLFGFLLGGLIATLIYFFVVIQGL